ncbi:MAG: hypothetical protein QG594_1962 [Bacteroidota bacterium]|nr:hypothetical protein [Bacteroidota bacterium]
MKNYKVFTSIFVFAMVILPGLTFAQNQVMGSVYVIPSSYDPSIVQTETVSYSNQPVAQNSQNTTVVSGTDVLPNNILGIHIKTKAERDAERATKEADLARQAELARVARNPDGTFAYGYTNGTGAQYANNTQYTDARNGTNKSIGSRNVASVGIFSGGFLPTTFWGWVLLILLIAIFVAIVRAFIDKTNSNQNRLHARAHATH